jgi:hypothetical protein
MIAFNFYSIRAINELSGHFIMRNIFLSITAFFSCIIIPAEIPEYYRQFFSNEALWEQINQETEIINSFFKVNPLKLCPQLTLKESIEKTVKELEPTLSVEYLLIYKTDNVNNSNPENYLKIYNTLRSISTLTGIEYYSASRERMRTFFYDACVIDNPESNIRQPDPLVEEIPGFDKFYIYTEDSSLGKNISTVTYFKYSNYMAMVMENYSTIWKFIFPIIQPGEMKTYMVIIPYEEYILFYGFSTIKTFELISTAEKKGIPSTTNRLKAFYNWFKDNYSAE